MGFWDSYTETLKAHYAGETAKQRKQVVDLQASEEQRMYNRRRELKELDEVLEAKRESLETSKSDLNALRAELEALLKTVQEEMAKKAAKRKPTATERRAKRLEAEYETVRLEGLALAIKEQKLALERRKKALADAQRNPRAGIEGYAEHVEDDDAFEQVGAAIHQLHQP